MPGLCIAVEADSDGKPAPCLMAQPPGALVYAAAWRDRAGNIQDWYELWVQDPDSWMLEGDNPLVYVTNPGMAAQWAAMVDGFLSASPRKVVCMGFEREYPEPIWLTGSRLRCLGRPATVSAA